MGCTCRWPPTSCSPRYFSRALAERIDALIWPTLTYGAYPAFVAYAGSVSLSNQTFQAVVTEIADALIGFGARRVLILDTGLSTIAPVAAAIRVSREPSRVRHLKVFAGPRFEATVHALQAAAIRQPCRRDGDLADAGDRAGTGRHDAGRGDVPSRPMAPRPARCRPTIPPRPTTRRAAASATPRSPRRKRESGCAPPSSTICSTRRPNRAATRERLDYVTDCGLGLIEGRIGSAVPKSPAGAAET